MYEIVEFPTEAVAVTVAAATELTFEIVNHHLGVTGRGSSSSEATSVFTPSPGT